MPYVKNPVKHCETCGEVHTNRVSNQCNSCRFGNCQECGCIIDDGNSRSTLCYDCYLLKLSLMRRKALGGCVL